MVDVLPGPDGRPAVVRLVSQRERASVFHRAAAAGIQGPPGYVLLYVHGSGGVGYVGSRRADPADVAAVVGHLGVDAWYVAPCQAAAGASVGVPGSGFAALFRDAVRHRVVATPSISWLNPWRGWMVAALAVQGDGTPRPSQEGRVLLEFPAGVGEPPQATDLALPQPTVAEPHDSRGAGLDDLWLPLFRPRRPTRDTAAAARPNTRSEREGESGLRQAADRARHGSSWTDPSRRLASSRPEWNSVCINATLATGAWPTTQPTYTGCCCRPVRRMCALRLTGPGWRRSGRGRRLSWRSTS